MVIKDVSFEDMLNNMKNPHGVLYLVSYRDHTREIMDELSPAINRGELFKDPRLNIFFSAVGEAYHNAIRHGNKFYSKLCASVKIWTDRLGNYLARVKDSGVGFDPLNVVKMHGGFAMYTDKSVITSFEDNGTVVNIQFMTN